MQDHSKLFIKSLSEVKDILAELKLGRKSMVAVLNVLFKSVSHGCKASRYKEALDLYAELVLSAIPNLCEHFKCHEAWTDIELDIIRSFFDVPWSTPVSGLPLESNLFILDAASLRLMSVNREYETGEASQARTELMREMEPQIGLANFSWYNLKSIWEESNLQSELTKETEALLKNDC